MSSDRYPQGRDLFGPLAAAHRPDGALDGPSEKEAAEPPHDGALDAAAQEPGGHTAQTQQYPEVSNRRCV